MGGDVERSDIEQGTIGSGLIRPMVDRLRARVDESIEFDPGWRSPALLEQVLPMIDRALRYVDPEVRGFEHVPDEGPFLLVANHSGGIYMPDYWAFLREWLHQRGAEAPLYSLGFDFMFAIPGAATMARRMGAVPASPENAVRLLDTGAAVLVYPGGDHEDYRPWTDRNRIDLAGHQGFVRLALRQQVPVVPLVAHGSHNVMVVLARGESVARRLGFDRLRINVLPVVAGPPWGLAVAPLPVWPLPTKVLVQLGEPIDWSASGLGADAADDPETVQRCYDEIVEKMQSTLDDLVEELPHPVLTRLRTATGLDRFRRR